MTFLHVSDLHVGKRLCGKSLMEDQRHILDEILSMAAQPEIDAVLVAGDLYDKSQPGGEAVELVGGFLTALSRLGKPAFVVSGNHDSPEQVAYCGELLRTANLFVSDAFTGAPRRHVLHDAAGEVHVYLLPFLRPMQARRAFPNRAGEIKTYADALRIAVEEIHLEPGVRSVLVAHQFVVGGEMLLTDSEERMVGGVDALPAEIFRDFDYVALGHLHAPQRCGTERVRYAGSPLKYSLSEERQQKAALKVTLGAQGELEVERLPYHPLRDVKRVRGELADLVAVERPDMDYVFVTLTDEWPPIDPVGAILQRYPNYVQLRMENSRTGASVEAQIEQIKEKSVLEHFQDFFIVQNKGHAPTEGQMQLMREIIEEAEVKLGASH